MNLEKEEDKRLLKELEGRPGWKIYIERLKKEASSTLKALLDGENVEFNRGYIRGLLFKIDTKKFIKDIERELEEDDV